MGAVRLLLLGVLTIVLAACMLLTSMAIDLRFFNAAWYFMDVGAITIFVIVLACRPQRRK